MNRNKVFTAVVGVCVVAVGVYFAMDYFTLPKPAPEPTPIVKTEPPKPAPEIKIEGTPITQAKPKPTVEIKQDEQGNQEIKPVIPKEVAPAPVPEPAPVPVPQPVPEPKPVAKPAPAPAPKPVAKPQPKPVAKPKPNPAPSTPQIGDTRYVNGQEQMYVPGQGWLDVKSGGTSTEIDATGNGNIIGY